MSKKNLIVAAALVLLALSVWLFISSRQTPVTREIRETSVIITVSGKEYACIPLSSPQTVTVHTGDGHENVLQISEDGVVMLSANCDNQLCVRMGKVTEENWEYRPNGAFIICLPHQVSAELVVIP